MVFLTGDTHGQADFEKMTRFAQEHPDITRNDYVIIAGDLMAIWSADTLESELKPYCDLPYTVLFIDGNHENFDILNAYPVEMWKGGKVHKIKPNIIHLMRGQVFEIDGVTVFTLGGAASIDKEVRTEGLDWWRQEQPTELELAEGIKNLGRYGNKVDYIVTHTCCARALKYPPLDVMQVFPANSLLSKLDGVVRYKHWYFGHYHYDAKLTDDLTVVYQRFYRLV